jgi:transposase
VVTYPAVLDVPREVVACVAALIAMHRADTGSRWRRLRPYRQAVLALVWMRKGETFASLAAGFGIGVSTAHRYCHEVAGLLAAHAPTLDEVMTAIEQAGWAVLDGTLVPTDRVADKRFNSGKHRAYGVNVQALISPTGQPLWCSPPLPGSTHDITAARAHGIIDAIVAAGVSVLADKAYRGAGLLVPYQPYNGRQLTPARRACNRAHSALRNRGERGFATLKTWRILRRLRCCPWRAEHIVRAILVLEHL